MVIIRLNNYDFDACDLLNYRETEMNNCSHLTYKSLQVSFNSKTSYKKSTGSYVLPS